jgi:hypothetical protein
VNTDTIEEMGVRPILGDYLIEDRGVARHNTDRVAQELLSLVANRTATPVHN